MSAKITTLISGRDAREIIRDEISAILFVESEEQQRLAALGSLDPEKFALRVFSERAAPWTAFSDEEGYSVQFPIVNVWFETSISDKSRSNTIDRQTFKATFHVDCYGFGVATETREGHDTADEMAQAEAERAARLVRQIIMSGHYTRLGFKLQKELTGTEKQVVLERWISSITAFQPSINDVPVERVSAIRVDVEVDHDEWAPQYVAQNLELIQTTLSRTGGGEWFTAEYQVSAPA